MKKILLLLTVIFSLAACAQNATWTGTKTFGSTLKFGSVIQNDLNTKILSIDSTGKPGWVDKSTITSPGSTQNLQQVTTVGNTTTNNINVSETSGSFNTTSLRGDGLWFIPDGSEYVTRLIQGNGLNTLTTIEMPQNDGRLITDAPNNSQSYVRKNGVWSIASSNYWTLTGTDLQNNSSTSVFNRGAGNEPRNTAFGQNSLISNTTGFSNCSYGKDALNFNTTGFANTAIGKDALRLNTSGSYNTALGAASMINYNGPLNSQNTAVGAFSMFTSTGGSANSAFGAQAMQNHTTGARNVAIGSGSGFNLKSGNSNTGLGYASLGGVSSDMSGSSNIALGFQAGRDLTTGSSNILIENTTGSTITSGNSNIILNALAGSGITTGSGNVIIGGYSATFPSAMNETIVIGTGTGIQRLVIDSNGIARLVAGAPVYLDNAAAQAGGLTAGNIYRTALGVLMIVY